MLTFYEVSECIKLLQSDSTLPVQRARMRIRVNLPASHVEKLKPRLLEAAETLENEETADEWSGVSGSFIVFRLPR